MALKSIQDALTRLLIDKARERSANYIPTNQDYSEWEALRSEQYAILGINCDDRHRYNLKDYDYWGRKSKVVLRMPHGGLEDGHMLGPTVFVVNGLDMVAIATKAAETRSVITFREIRETYRQHLQHLRADANSERRTQRPIFIRVLHSPRGTVQTWVHSPAPWEPDWIEYVAPEHFSRLGLQPAVEMPPSQANKFFAVRGSDLWSLYAPTFIPGGKRSI
jgi:hypothetical protein